jgi:hypothetical protein
MVDNKVQSVSSAEVEVVAAWDAEQIYRTLVRWGGSARGLTLAPFGPKPHTLGMALYALKHGAGMYYAQPQAYNPDYCQGTGETWAYVVKWDGVMAYDRVVASV